ncbi:MAG: hypothetical protein U0939_15605 [Pirellulales bacterium]
MRPRRRRDSTYPPRIGRAWVVAGILLALADMAAAQTSSPSPASPSPLAARQRALERRVEDLEGRFRELANELAESEPEQSERVVAALARLGDLQLHQRIRDAAAQIEQGAHEPAAAVQRSLLEDLQKLQRFLRTGRDDEPAGDGVVEELADALQAALSAQRQLRVDAAAVVARRAADGAWRRPERLALANLAKSQRDISQSLASFPDRLPDSSVWQIVAAQLRRTLEDQADVARSLSELQIDSTLDPRLQDLASSLEELAKLLRPQANRRGEQPSEATDSQDAEAGGEQELPLSVALRALQGEQRRVLERTRQLDQLQRDSPDREALSAALDRLLQRQQQLAQQLRELLAQQAPAP